MKNSPHKHKHEKHKAVRKAQDLEYVSPEKTFQPSKYTFFHSKKKRKIDAKKASSLKNHHKTSPRDVTWHTEPDDAHREGRHWLQVIKKQAKDGAEKLRQKLQKIRRRSSK